MPNDNLTYIALILDRSGSMASIRDDTIGGVNRFVEDQKAAPGDAIFTLIQFDDVYERPIPATPLQKVEPLTKTTFVPRGSTALLDAVARGIDEIGAELAAMPEPNRPGKVLVMIVTDGLENASKTHKRQDVFDRITRQRETYKWEFIYLGANQDAFAEAGSMGIPSTHTSGYVANAVGTASAYYGGTKAAWNYRSGGTAALAPDPNEQA